MTPTLTETVDLLNDIDREYARLARLTLSAMQHLIAEQADAMAPLARQGGVKVTGGSSDNVAIMLARMAALNPYGYKNRQITAAIGDVKRSLRDWQRVLDDVISDRPPPNEERPRCPGARVDADGRLGGCGNLTERYHEGGKVKYRPICRTCRTQGKFT